MKWNRIICTLFFLHPLMTASAAFETPTGPTADPAHALNRFTPELPDIRLINQDGETVELSSLLEKKRNTLFAFFFTQCITICTATTFTLKSVENRVPENTTLAMISIDPDNDTPEALARYSREHQLPSPRWQLLTGEASDLEALQRSLASYRANKMNHKTSIFVKTAGSSSLTEITGTFRVIPQLFKARPQAIE